MGVATAVFIITTRRHDPVSRERMDAVVQDQRGRSQGSKVRDGGNVRMYIRCSATHDSQIFILVPVKGNAATLDHISIITVVVVSVIVISTLYYFTYVVRSI